MPILNFESAVADAHLERINQRLPRATPQAAYTLGLISVIVFRDGVDIPECVLDGAMTVKSLDEGSEYAKAVLSLRDAK